MPCKRPECTCWSAQSFFILAHGCRGICHWALPDGVVELAGTECDFGAFSFHLETSKTGHSCVALLCFAKIIFYFYLSSAVGSPNQSQMMSRTRSLFHPLHRRRQERAGHCLSILLGRRRAALEGRRSFTRSWARQRSSRERPVMGRSPSLSTWKSAWLSCTNMARIVFCMKEGRSRRARNGSSEAICV